MPDNPHDPDRRPEASFIIAAETAIQGLYTRLDRAEKAARWRTVWTVLLGCLTVLVIILSVMTLSQARQSSDFSHQLQQKVIASCQEGNRFKAQQVQVWNFFIDSLVARPVGADVKAEVAAFKQWALGVSDGDPRLIAQARQAGMLMDRLSGNVKDPRLPAFVRYLKGYIAQVDAPKNCTQSFSTRSG